MPHEHLQQRAALAALSRASDAADIVAHLGTVALSRGVDGCVVSVIGARSVAYVAHVNVEKIPVARTICGRAPAAESELARAALKRREPMHVRGAASGDPLERVRAEWNGDEIAVVPLWTDAGELGVIAMVGRRIALEHVRSIELLATAAANALERLATIDGLRAAVRARDAALAVLTSLNEKSTLPQVFFDESLRVIANNDAFVELSARSAEEIHGASFDEFGFAVESRLRPAIVRVIERKTTERVELIERHRAFIVTVHPVSGIAAAGVTFVDVTELQAVVVQSRAIADAAMLIGVSDDAATAIDVLTATCARALADCAITMRANGDVEARAGDGEIELERVVRELVARVPSRGPARVAKTAIADALTVDDLALLRLPAPPSLHLLSVPLRTRDDLRIVVLGRRRKRAPFGAGDVALATDVARIAARSLDEYAATAAANAWAEMFADFVATLSRELRDSTTALLTRLYMNEHASPGDRASQIAPMRRIAERMRESLQRLDRTLPTPPRGPVNDIDLAAIAGEVARDAAVRIAPGARLYEQLSSVPAVQGHRHRIREALRGVAEHVVATASGDALICARVEEVGSEIVIAFSRTGPGYGPDEARRVFDALWDGRDTARALTIARAVFEAHGGRAWVETSEDAGVAYCFAISPRARATVA